VGVIKGSSGCRGLHDAVNGQPTAEMPSVSRTIKSYYGKVLFLSQKLLEDVQSWHAELKKLRDALRLQYSAADVALLDGQANDLETLLNEEARKLEVCGTSLRYSLAHARTAIDASSE